MNESERTLYYVNGSIPSWMVALALHEKGLAFLARRLRVMGAQRETKSPEFLALNPRGKTPVLVEPALGADEPEVVIRESLAILHYLERRYPAPPLLPRSEPARLARVLVALHEALILQCAYRPIEQLFVKDAAALSDLERQRILQADQELHEELLHWEARARAEAHIADAGFTLADCAFYPTLAYLLRRGLVLDRYPALQGYAERVRQRPAAVAAHPEGWPHGRTSTPNLFALVTSLRTGEAPPAVAASDAEVLPEG